MRHYMISLTGFSRALITPSNSRINSANVTVRTSLLMNAYLSRIRGQYFSPSCTQKIGDNVYLKRSIINYPTYLTMPVKYLDMTRYAT